MERMRGRAGVAKGFHSSVISGDHSAVCSNALRCELNNRNPPRHSSTATMPVPSPVANPFHGLSITLIVGGCDDGLKDRRHNQRVGWLMPLPVLTGQPESTLWQVDEQRIMQSFGPVVLRQPSGEVYLPGCGPLQNSLHLRLHLFLRSSLFFSQHLTGLSFRNLRCQ